MNNMIKSLIAFTGLGLALIPTLSAGTHKRARAPVVITRPAIPDGSNFSRAPFPAARQQNDVTPPNGEAFDQNMAPNTPSTTPEPMPAPAPVVAVLQPRVAPGLMPTGRPVAASAGLVQVTPVVQNATFQTRDDVIDRVRVGMRQGDTAVREYKRTESEMSAQGRTQFEAARNEVKAREKALDRSLRTAANASASGWDSARAQLAADYQAYVQSLARLDQLVGVTPAR
jgi:hypothetical protein